jgi:hypothetical protein
MSESHGELGSSVSSRWVFDACGAVGLTSTFLRRACQDGSADHNGLLREPRPRLGAVVETGGSPPQYLVFSKTDRTAE